MRWLINLGADPKTQEDSHWQCFFTFAALFAELEAVQTVTSQTSIR
jgi:hypothetical protein